jgi:hypothetical protein
MRKILVLVVASLSLATCGDSGGGSSGGLCAQIGTALCAKACSCRDGATCAISQDGLVLTFDTETDCTGLYVTFGCSMGDMAAYNNAATCLPLVQAAACTGTGTEGAVEYPDDIACQSPP